MSVSVSVVIPVYNSEKYLGQCLNSVLGQSLHDIEVICVDDGSTDNSASVIQERMKEDSRLKIVRHGVNKGVGAARNTGVEAAEGEWIYFLDSDDWIDSDYLEVMLREASASGLEAVVNASYYWENLSKGVRNKGKLSLFDSDQESLCLPGYIIQNKMLPVVWTRLYRRNFIRSRGIVFPSGVQFSEDVYFTTLASAYMQSEYIFRGPYYHHQVRKGALSDEPNVGYQSICVFRELYHELIHRGLSHEGLRLFYSGPLLIDSSEKFCIIKEFLTEIKPEVIGHKELYVHYDLFLLDLITSCSCYEDYIERYSPNMQLNYIKSLNHQKVGH